MMPTDLLEAGLPQTFTSVKTKTKNTVSAKHNKMRAACIRGKKKSPEEQLVNFNNDIHVWRHYGKCSVLCFSCFSYFKR